MMAAYRSLMKRLNNTGPKTDPCMGDTLCQWQPVAGQATDPHPLPPARQVWQYDRT